MKKDLLLKVMAEYMNINKFDNESDLEYVQRVVYSAIGQWVLASSFDINTEQTDTGINCRSRKGISIKCKEILHSYTKIFPEVSDWFYNKKYGSSIKLIIDRYINSGVLVSGPNNTYQLASSKYSKISDKLYYLRGVVSNEKNTVCGLGVYSDKILSDKQSNSSINELFNIPKLSASQFTNKFIKQIDPYFKINNSVPPSREYFNPRSRKSFSTSWEKKYWNGFGVTVYRNNQYDDYGLVRYEDGKLLTFPFPKYITQTFETKRIMYGLRSNVRNPSACKLKVRGDYVNLSLYSTLPGCEENMMYQISWPSRSAGDSVQFTTTKDFLPLINDMLNRLNIKVETA